MNKMSIIKTKLEAPRRRLGGIISFARSDLAKLIARLMRVLGRVKFLHRVLFPLKNLSSKNQKIAIGTALIVILIMVPVIFYSLSHLRGASAAWFDENFGYRQRVDITNSGSAQTDFQVSFTLDTATLVTAGKMRSDCNDIRITDTNGKLLPFVIEEGSGACNTSTTKIWTKVPTISTTGDTLYVYYGNPQAVNKEDGTSVFNFYENFSASTLNGRFTATGAYTISGGAITITTGAVYSSSTVVGDARNSIFEYRTKWASTVANYAGMEIANASSTQGGNAGSNKLIYSMSNGAVSIAQRGWAADGTLASYNLATDAVLYTPTAATYYVDGFSMDSTNIKFYNNGSTTNTTTGSWTAAPYLFLGYFTGSTSSTTDITDITVDWVRARKYAATAPTVASPANEEKSPAPVGYWKFDEGTGTTASDSSSNRNNGTLTNMASPSSTNSGWMNDTACISGKCLAFDGVDDSVSAPNASSKIANSNITLSGWVKPNASQVGHAGYFGIRNDGTADFYVLQLSGGTSLEMRFRNSGGTFYQCSGVSVTPNQWNFISFVYDGSNIYCYVNGQLKNSTSASGSITLTTEAMKIGSNNGNNFFNGFIDEPKLYNYARSSDQIKVDYNSRGGEGANVLGTSDANKNLSNGLVGYWKMDEASWTIDCSTSSVLDASGNGNNGKSCPTTTGPAGGSTGKFGNAGSFDGSNDYVNITDSTSLRPSTAVSVGAWVKPGTATQAGFGILDKRWDNSTDPYNSYIIDVEGTTYHYMFCVSNGTTGSQSCVYSTSSLTTTWTHVVGTYDGSFLKIYVNGVLEGTAEKTGTIGYTSQPLRIGCALAGGQCFNGLIDEARIYNRALSSREVQQLYNFAPGPVHYWKMEEGSGSVLIDSSGENTATISGNTTWAPGKYGKGLTFDGNSDYAVVGTAPSVNANGSFTYEAWVKVRSYTNGTTGDGGGTYIIDRDSGTTPLAGLKPVADGYGFQVRYDDSTGLGGPSGGRIRLNEWQHIAMVRDYNSAFTIYVDGVKVGSTVDSGSKTLTVPRPKLGGHATVCSCMDGMMDEFKIYNYARTPGQIVEDMNGGHPAPGSPVGSPVAYFKLDDGFGNVASSSGNIATMSAGLYSFASTPTASSGWTQNGKFDKALAFDGVNDHMNIPNVPALNPASITLSAWIYLPHAPTANGNIIAKGQNTGYRIRVNNNMTVLFLDRGATNAIVTTQTLSTRRWYHIVGTGDSSGLKIYIDGVLAASNSTAYGGPVNAYDVTVGLDIWDGGEYFNGLIDEVKIYNSALTAEQVKLDYNRGSSQVLGSLSDTSGLTGGSVASNSASAEYCVPGDTTSCASPVGRWNFEEGKGTNANDKSGNNYNGSLTGGPSWTTGKYGKAISFDGTDDYVNAGSASVIGNLTSSITVSVWIYPTNLTGFHRIIAPSRQTSANGWAFGTSGSSLIFTTFGVKDYTSVTATLATNRWYYVTAVMDSAFDVTFYINGVKYDTILHTAAGNANTDDNLFIGTTTTALSATLTEMWSGKVDDLRVYNYERTQAQVAWDYNQGKPVGHWKFDECQGSTINNSIGTTSGTLNIGATGSEASIGTCSTSSTAWGNGATGKLNYSVDLDGTDDYISTSNTSSLFDFTTGFTVSAWIKRASTQNSVDSGIISKFNESTGDGYLLWYNGNTVDLYMNGAIRANSTTTIPADTWTHVIGVWDGSNAKIYINGKLSVSSSYSTAPGGIGQPFSIGRYSAILQRYFTGSIDDVKVYNYGLTNTQIKVLYNNGAVTFAPSTGAP